MGILLTTLGIVVVAASLRDIFHTLLHPRGRGRISHLLAAGVWKMSKFVGMRYCHLAGPLTMVIVIVAWTLSQAVGWALIYYPHIPGGFSYSPGVDPDRYSNLAEALYVSLVSLSTLGFGDMVPTNQWLRLLAPIQALIGFALLTAALSWFTQIYPALGRRRALAVRLQILESNSYADSLDKVGATVSSRVLEEVANGIIQARIDLTQNTETYYFRDIESRLSLAASITYGITLSEKAKASAVEGTRLNGRILQAALDDLAQHLARVFGAGGDSTRDIFAFFARDHGHAATGEDRSHFSGP